MLTFICLTKLYPLYFSIGEIGQLRRMVIIKSCDGYQKRICSTFYVQGLVIFEEMDSVTSSWMVNSFKCSCFKWKEWKNFPVI